MGEVDDVDKYPNTLACLACWVGLELVLVFAFIVGWC